MREFVTEVAAEKLSPAPIQYAGFWRRVMASLIDSVVFYAAIALVLGPSSADPELISIPGLIKNALMIILIIVMWIRFLGTPGKLLLGCQVVDATTLAALTLKQAIIRYLGYYLSLAVLGFGFFMVGWDKRKQGLHDKLADTVVVYNSNLAGDDESQKTLRQLLSEVK